MGLRARLSLLVRNSHVSVAVTPLGRTGHAALEREGSLRELAGARA